MKNCLAPVVILAGGLATRLKSMAENTPKSLVKIHGIPFINYQLNLLKHEGVNEVYLLLGHLGMEVAKHVGTGRRYGLNIHNIFDGAKTLGTGGAIMNALPQLPNVFFVMYGDSYLPINFKEIQNEFFQKKYRALLSIFQNENRWDQSNIEFKTDKIIAYNKIHMQKNMNFIDYGLGLFAKSAFEMIDKPTPSDLSEYFSLWIENNMLNGYQVFERFYEIGSFQGISDFSDYINANKKVAHE